jgi:hypothetical protein
MAARNQYSNFPGGSTSMGIPQIGQGVPATFGNYWFVDATYGRNGNSGQATGAAFQSLEYALTRVTNSNDDVIVLRGGATYNLDAMLDMSSFNRTHLVGLDGAWRNYGQGAKVQFTGTTGATNIATILNGGTRNSFANIKFIQASTITECLYTAADGGEYAVWENCEFYQSENLDQTTAAEFLWNGDSTQMRNCTVGSLADALVGSIIRPCVKLTATLAGKKCRDGLIQNTRMWRNASATTNTFVYGANATDVERTLTMEHVGFINNGASAFKPAQCVQFGATQTVGQVTLDPDCYSQNVTKISTTTGVFVTGPASAATAGVPTQAA